MCRDCVQFQRNLAIKPAMFFLTNNEPCLMPMLLLGSFDCLSFCNILMLSCSLISDAFVARFGEWKSLNDLILYCAWLPLQNLLSLFFQSPLPSSSCCAFSFEIARQYCFLSSFPILSSLELPRSELARMLRCSWSSSTVCLPPGPWSNEHECSHIWANDFE